MPADLLVIAARLFRPLDARGGLAHGSAAGPRPEGAPTAVAIADGRIAAVGTDDELLRTWRGPRTRVVDARGGLLTPGFDDAHTHLIAGARALDHVDLYQVATVDAIQARIAAHAAAHPDAPWVVGRGWLYVPFPGGLPTRQQLDAVVPDRPAYLECYDGHTGWVNSRALELAGIDRDTPDPAFGAIVRDASGEPTGALKEDAQELVTRLLPVPSRDEDRASLRRAFAAHHRVGITAAQDAMVELDDVPTWRAVLEAGELGLRVRLGMLMQPGGTLEAWRERLAAYTAAVAPFRGGPWLDSGIVKGFVDGVIEARTAVLLAPYVGLTADDPHALGHPNWAPGELEAAVAAADRAGWQVELHAIGDGAVRRALDAHRAAVAGSPDPGRERRHRVEHLETVDAADIPRFGAEGVVASMQPYHADPSPNQIDLWAGNIGPDRASRAWPWRSIADAGGVVALGSDWPVVPFDPFLALHGAVTRETVDGEPPGGWLPTERLPLERALAALTTGSAFAAFAEGRRGRIEPGWDADLALLDRDLLAEGPSAILGTTVRCTVLDGRVVHDSEGLG